MNRRVSRSHLMISFGFKGSAVSLPGSKSSCTIPFTTGMTLDKLTNPLASCTSRRWALAQGCGGGRISQRQDSVSKAGRWHPMTAACSPGHQGQFCRTSALLSHPRHLFSSRVSPSEPCATCLKMTWMGGVTCRMHTPGPCL